MLTARWPQCFLSSFQPQLLRHQPGWFVECSGFAGRNQCHFGGERLSVELQNSASGPDGIEGQTVKMLIRKFILESAWILLLLLHPGVVHAVTPVTIFIDMETGNPSDLF